MKRSLLRASASSAYSPRDACRYQPCPILITAHEVEIVVTGNAGALARKTCIARSDFRSVADRRVRALRASRSMRTRASALPATGHALKSQIGPLLVFQKIDAIHYADDGRIDRGAGFSGRDGGRAPPFLHDQNRVAHSGINRIKREHGVARGLAFGSDLLAEHHARVLVARILLRGHDVS